MNCVSAIFWLGMLVVVLVGGAVGVTFPYALSTDHDILNQHIQMATAILKQVPLIDGYVVSPVFSPVF